MIEGVVTPGMAAMKGKEAMRPVLKTLLADPNLKLEISAQRVEVAASDDVAFEKQDHTRVAFCVSG